MPITLRPIQVDFYGNVQKEWDVGHKNVMGVSATGSGKTVVIAHAMHDEPGASIAIAHRQELVSQISTALARNGLRHRIVGAKRGATLPRMIAAIHTLDLGYSFIDPSAKVGVGGVDTIIRMDATDPYFKQVRLKVQDEGHHVLVDNKWGKADAMFPQARGFYPTATPRRADGRGLGRHCGGLMDAMVLAPTMRDIIDMGYLTDYRIIADESNVDISGVGISQATGDLNQAQLRAAIHKSDKIVGDVVHHYLKYAAGKLGVTFAVDVESATEIAAAFRAKGVPAEVVSSKTPDTLRAQILRRFKAREILQLVNVDLFGEGFDLPAIEVVSFARHTESFALYCQQFGRALRLMLSKFAAEIHGSLTDAQRLAAIAASEKPVAIIIDHVGNVIRHGGPPDRRDIVWSLEGSPARGKSDSIPMRNCVECKWPYERFYKCCPRCGHYPEPALRSAPEYVDGDLTELDAATLAAMRGDIVRIDGDPVIPWGASPEIAGAVRRRHWERQQSQVALRNHIAWWAGLESGLGRTESESYRRFYHKFGIDVASCQALGVKESSDLTTRIAIELGKYGIDGKVDALLYFGATA